jgi:hypothetical protein
MGDPDAETSLIGAVDRYIPARARVMLHLGSIVLASLVFWLGFFWFGSITLILPMEVARELAASNLDRLRLLFGMMAAMPTVAVGVLVYWLWLLGQARKAQRMVKQSQGRQPWQGPRWR